MAKKQARRKKPSSHEYESRKVGILLPSDVYATYEQIARDEHITVAQVIARVAIDFADVENEASRSRRAVLSSYKEQMLAKLKPGSGTQKEQ